MAAQPKKKTSKVRSKTRRAHRHDSIKDENLWQSGMLPKKERREQFAQYRRKKSLSTSPKTETTTDTKAKAAAPKTTKKTSSTSKESTKKKE